MASLTATQKSRALATVAGVKPSEIAAAQNGSKQAVAASIAKPAVRAAVRELLGLLVVSETSADGSVTHKTFQQCALETVAEALRANRVFTFGNDFVERPDWPTRLAAADRIFAFAEPAILPPIATTEKPTIVEETVETHRRATRRREQGR